MTTLPSTTRPSDTPTRSLPAGVWIFLAVLAAVVAVVAYHARVGAISPRIANPAVTGVPRPVEFLSGPTDWLVVHQVGTVIMMSILVAACVRAWRRQPGHPYVLMVLA